MNNLAQQDLGCGITCIDADYMQPGTACFYLLQQDNEYAVVETGTSHCVPAFMQLLDARGIAPAQVQYVIPTHVHLDHAGGAGALMAQLPEARLLIHPRGARHMADPERLIAGAVDVYGADLFQQLYGEIVPVEAERITQIGDGETISLADRVLEFRHTRGHAEHHFTIWDAASRGWFCGDMFGVSYPWFRHAAGDFVMPSTTPTQFDPQSYLDSLELLGSYGPKCMYLTHYGLLDYAIEKAQLLVRQVEAYCEYAAAHNGEPKVLQQQLSDYSLQLLRQFDATTAEAELRRFIEFDVQLNTQGLLVWQHRLMGD